MNPCRKIATTLTPFGHRLTKVNARQHGIARQRTPYPVPRCGALSFTWSRKMEIRLWKPAPGSIESCAVDTCGDAFRVGFIYAICSVLYTTSMCPPHLGNHMFSCPCSPNAMLQAIQGPTGSHEYTPQICDGRLIIPNGRRIVNFVHNAQIASGPHVQPSPST